MYIGRHWSAVEYLNNNTVYLQERGRTFIYIVRCYTEITHILSLVANNISIELNLQTAAPNAKPIGSASSANMW